MIYKLKIELIKLNNHFPIIALNKELLKNINTDDTRFGYYGPRGFFNFSTKYPSLETIRGQNIGRVKEHIAFIKEKFPYKYFLLRNRKVIHFFDDYIKL